MSATASTPLTGKHRRTALLTLCKEETKGVSETMKKIASASAEIGRLQAQIEATPKSQKEQIGVLRGTLVEHKAQLKALETEVADALSGIPQLLKASGKRSGVIGSHYQNVEGFEEVEKKATDASESSGGPFDGPIMISATMAAFFAKSKLGKTSDGKHDLAKSLAKLLESRVLSSNVARDLFSVYAYTNGLRLKSGEEGKGAEGSAAREHKAYMKISPEMRKAFGESNVLFAGKESISYSGLSTLIKNEKVVELSEAQQKVIDASADAVAAARTETRKILGAIKGAEKAAEEKVRLQKQAEKQAAAEARKVEKEKEAVLKAAEREKKQQERAAAKEAKATAAAASASSSSEEKPKKERKTAPPAKAAAEAKPASAKGKGPARTTAPPAAPSKGAKAAAAPAKKGKGAAAK